MTIRSIIIDDESNNIDNARALLREYCPAVEVVATAMNAAEGIEVIRDYRPDLVFLDIQMPVQNGFEVLKAFSRIDFEIIFVTAFDQYGIQAIKFSALDYLLKPIDIEELKKAVAKAADALHTRRMSQNIVNLMEYIRMGRKEIPKIALPTQQEILYVRIDEIIRCEASNNYTNFVLENGQTVLVCKTLKEFDELLKPYGFLRPHQSHLVNANCVRSYLREDGGLLLMKDEIKVPIARQKRESIKDALGRI